MKIEAITVCIGYDDFLAETIKCNAHLFDKWIIVTEPADHATQDLCAPSIACNACSPPRKPATARSPKVDSSNVPLQHTSQDAWRLHLDADIALPAYFRKRLDDAHIDPDYIYGVDRLMVKSWQEWQNLLSSGYLLAQQSNPYCLTFPSNLPLGARWASHAGWVPIGFFQLWHASQDERNGVRVKPYPTNHGTACRTDVQHGLQWDRRKRALIPEIIAVHLESHASPNGTNWLGRKTKRFAPIPTPSNPVGDMPVS